jgi:hypothetical protein
VSDEQRDFCLRQGAFRCKPDNQRSILEREPGTASVLFVNLRE